MKSENIGYKVFDHDWTCREFQFEIGKEYIHKGEIKICGAGFFKHCDRCPSKGICDDGLVNAKH